MDALLGWLPLVGCAAMMFVCLRMMSMGSKDEHQERDDASLQQQIAELREEVARLRAGRAGDERERSRG